VQRSRAGKLECENGDVVFLAKVLGGLSNLSGNFEGKRGETVEAVEFSPFGACLDNAIRHQDQLFMRSQLSCEFGITLIIGKAEGQTGPGLRLAALDLWEMWPAFATVKKAVGLEPDAACGACAANESRVQRKCLRLRRYWGHYTKRQ